MSWEKYAYTSAGAAMLSESISGGALTITRAVSGTGTIDTDLSEETAVSGDTYELKLLGIDTVEYKGEKARKVSIWTGGADEPYFMHQIGVFGRLNDDPEDTLLFLMQVSTANKVCCTYLIWLKMKSAVSSFPGKKIQHFLQSEL